MSVQDLSKRRGRQPNPQARYERREQIILAAQTCFKARGFHATSTSEISKAANISSAGLYQYFASKDALIEALVEREIKTGLELIYKLKDEADFFSGLDKLYHEICANDEIGMGMGLRAEIFALASRSETVSQMLGGMEKSLTQAIEEVVSRAQENNQICNTLNAHDTAKAIGCFTNGIVIQMCLPEANRGPYILAIIDVLRAALAPRRPNFPKGN